MERVRTASSAAGTGVPSPGQGLSRFRSRSEEKRSLYLHAARLVRDDPTVTMQEVKSLVEWFTQGHDTHDRARAIAVVRDAAYGPLRRNADVHVLLGELYLAQGIVYRGYRGV